MAYAKRLQIEYDDINNIATRIEVWQEGYAGAVETRNYASGDVCCEVSWGDSTTKRLPLIYGSQVTLYFDSETNFEFHDFFTANSRKNKILVYKNNSLFHVAFGEADTWAEPFSYPPYEVSFTGYDGLGLLKNEDFKDENKDYYEGEMTLLEILTLLLSKNGLELPFNTAVSIRPSGASAGADALTQVLKDVFTYRDLSCYDVLEALFRGCRIMQREGEWWIVNNDLWNQTTITFRKYTAAGAANGTVVKDTRFAGFWMEGDGDLSFLPAMKQLNVTQDYGYLGNIIKNNNFFGFDDGVFEYWTAVGVFATQRLYDGDGNRYVYLPGKEFYDDWQHARTKYLKSHGIRLEATTNIPTFSLDFALVSYNRPAVVMFGIHLVADSGTHYNLKVDLNTKHEVIHVWEQTAEIKPVPCEDKMRKYDQGWWPNKTTHRYAQEVKTEGWPLDEVTEHFATKSVQIKEGIPESGVLTVYLFLAHVEYALFSGGVCFRNIEFKFLDEAGEEPPVETDFFIVNDAGNNYLPEDIKIINGSLPDIDNRLTIYHGGFIMNDGSGAAVDDWVWDGGGTAYGYAELIARYIAAEMKLPRLFHQSVLADSVPSLAGVWYDAVTGKYFLEAGIIYNDRMQATEGRYIETIAWDIDTMVSERDEVYNGSRTRGGETTRSRGTSTSGGRTGETRNRDAETGLYTHDYAITGTTGRLVSDEFRDITDVETGRTRMDQTITRIIVDQAAHGFQIGEALRYDPGTNLYVRAQADSEENAAVIGVVSDIYSSGEFGLKSAGVVPASNFLPGRNYVLSPTVPGQVVEKSAVTSWPEGSVELKIGIGSSEGLSINLDETGTDGDSAYVYIAYASDDAGTDFTTTFDPALNYIAILATDTEIETPAAGDFAGLWKFLGGGENDYKWFLHSNDISPAISEPENVQVIVDGKGEVDQSFPSGFFQVWAVNENGNTLAVDTPAFDILTDTELVVISWDAVIGATGYIVNGDLIDAHWTVEGTSFDVFGLPTGPALPVPDENTTGGGGLEIANGDVVDVVGEGIGVEFSFDEFDSTKKIITLRNLFNTFIGDIDTPGSYVGQAGKIPVVKSDEKGLEFKNICDLIVNCPVILDLKSRIELLELSAYIIKLTYDDIANVPVATADSVSDWNAFFDLPTYGNEFTSVIVTANTVMLYGGSNITIKEHLFGTNNEFVHNNALLKIEDTKCVVKVNLGSFFNCKKITDVSLPVCSEIEGSLSRGAFWHCDDLVNLNMPICETLGDYAFGSCSSLPGLNGLPVNIITYIPKGCFNYCTSLQELNFPLATSVDDNAFGNCTSVNDCNFPELLTTGYGAFSHLHSMLSITPAHFPKLTNAGERCFASLYSATSIQLNELLTAGDQCFSTSDPDLSIAVLIDLPKLTSAGSNCFQHQAKVTSFNLPLLQNAGTQCFQHCRVMADLSLPALTAIGQRAFEFCYDLANLSLPVCTDFGGTVGSDTMFTHVSGNIINLTIPAALMTCNGGNPDGDIQDLQANNTVTVIQV